MNEKIENILRNPAVVKTAEGDYTDEAPAIWAWFAHGYDTGMEPFYNIEQVRNAVRSVLEGGGREPSPAGVAEAARVLADFAKTAPGRLPQRVQDAIAVAAGLDTGISGGPK